VRETATGGTSSLQATRPPAPECGCAAGLNGGADFEAWHVDDRKSIVHGIILPNVASKIDSHILEISIEKTSA
jgi:hypothetical protein